MVWVKDNHGRDRWEPHQIEPDYKMVQHFKTHPDHPGVTFERVPSPDAPDPGMVATNVCYAALGQDYLQVSIAPDQDKMYIAAFDGKQQRAGRMQIPYDKLRDAIIALCKEHGDYYDPIVAAEREKAFLEAHPEHKNG